MDVENHLKNARRIAVLLDSKWQILGLRFGIDPLLNIIPGVSSLLSACISGYLIFIALALKVPVRILILMLGNIIFDYLVGLIPVLGVLFDVLYKANIRNLELLEYYFKDAPIEGEFVED